MLDPPFLIELLRTILEYLIISFNSQSERSHDFFLGLILLSNKISDA